MCEHKTHTISPRAPCRPRAGSGGEPYPSPPPPSPPLPCLATAGARRRKPRSRRDGGGTFFSTRRRHTAGRPCGGAPRGSGSGAAAARSSPSPPSPAARSNSPAAGSGRRVRGDTGDGRRRLGAVAVARPAQERGDAGWLGAGVRRRRGRPGALEAWWHRPRAAAARWGRGYRSGLVVRLRAPMARPGNRGAIVVP